ncbi:MAG: cytochrome c [Paucimonas sp.]|jgi:cytochrome c553|nr:cytochrome c [Paucimonas sp.]
MKKFFSFAVLATAFAVSLNAVAGGNVEAGKAAATKYNCFSCHGQDYNTPIDPTYPKLAGQHADYLEFALLAYRRGGDGANGRNNAIMGAQAKMLSPREIKDVAAYLHSLPGTLVLRK